MANHLKAGVVGGALVACLLAGCGGSTSSSLPKSQANVAVCKTLNQVQAGSVKLQQLVISLFENSQVSKPLRSEITRFATVAATSGVKAAARAESKAFRDCRSITSS